MNFRHFAFCLAFALGMPGGASVSLASDVEITENAAPPVEGIKEANTKAKSLIGRYTDNAQELVMRALSLIGVNYRRGGESPDSGFDCSGLVRHVFREALGLKLPRTSRDLSHLGANVPSDDLKPGDLVFFHTLHHAFSHVGIYLGDHQFVHAPASGGEVRVEDMRQSYWAKRFNGARRVAALNTPTTN